MRRLLYVSAAAIVMIVAAEVRGMYIWDHAHDHRRER